MSVSIATGVSSLDVSRFFSATGGGSGLVANGVPAPWAVALSAPLTHSLLPEFGPLPKHTRGDGTAGGRALATDNAGRLVRTKDGECVFYGARRVENLLRYTSNLTNAYWQVTLSSTLAAVFDSNIPGPRGIQNAFLFTRSTTANSVFRTATGVAYRSVPHVGSVWLKAGTATTAELRIYIPGGASLATKVVTLTSEWQRFSVSGTPNGSSSYVFGVTAGSFASTTAQTMYIADVMLEEKIDGSMAPSEYVSVDETAASDYYRGAAVDGVEYFDTAFANTVDGNGLVTETTGAKITGAIGVEVFASAIQQIVNNNAHAGWATKTNITATDNAGVAPTGLTTAISLDEGTATGTHQIFQTLTGVGAIAIAAAYNGSTWHNYSCMFKSGGSLQWIRLMVTDVGGTSKSAYFDILNGVAGTTISAGHTNVEQLANGWCRVMWSVPIYEGSGSADPILGIGFANGDGSGTSYTGTSRTALMFLPCYFTSTSSGALASAQRPISPPPVQTAGTAETLPGQAVVVNVRGLLGVTDFGMAVTYYPFYRIEQTDKQSYGGTAYIYTEAPAETRGATVGNLVIQRGGVSIRPPLSGGAANCKFAFDIYNGDSNPLYFWSADTDYEVGDFAIPLDTKPNNTTSNKIFRCVVAGTSGGSEPTWNTTYTNPADTTSNLTADGTVRWQVNVENGINGTFENYNGAEILADQGFMGEYKTAWFITTDDYGCYVNGVELHKQTEPRPLFPSKGYAFDAKPKTVFLGSIGTNSTGHSSMPPHRAVVRDLIIWHTAPTADVIQAATL